MPEPIHIFCHLIHSKWQEPVPGESFHLSAIHSDGSQHDLGKFPSEEAASAAAIAWKKQHQRPAE